MSIQYNDSTSAQLPATPVDGQIWIDGNRVRWRWSAESKVWVSIGTANSYPIADATTVGLMSAQDKRLLDSIPVIAGAFGIITDQNAIIASQDNRIGLVSGNIKLHSDSLNIECVSPDGTPYLGQALIDDPAGVNLSGLRFSLSDNFLDALCLEVTGPIGKKGEKGPTGEAGTDGFNDGPAGEKGDPGTDATVAHTFSGIKIVDTTDIVDTAVVSLQVDGSAGRLSYTTAKMNVPSNAAPADQLYAQPVQRSLSYPVVAEDGKDYVTLDDWTLSIPNGDPLSDDPEVLLVKIPQNLEVGEVASIELTKLTDLITTVVDTYKTKLSAIQDTWMAQMKSYIEEKDAAARNILASLAQQVAQCEFKRPLAFCLGIAPSDCSQGTASTSLTVSLEPSDTVMHVSSATGFPSQEYVVIVGTEHINITGGFGTTTWIVARGYDNTTAAAHSSGSSVTLNVDVDVPLISSGQAPQESPISSSGVSTSSSSSSDDEISDDDSRTMLMRSKYSTSAPFDPTDPAKCLLPYRLMQIVITDESNPVYVSGIQDPDQGVVNYYINDKSIWEKFISNLAANQIVALGLLQIPRTGSGIYGDIRDLVCDNCSLPYDSMRNEIFYHTLSSKEPKITADDIVTFVERMLKYASYSSDEEIKLCGSDFVPNQINILFKSKSLSMLSDSVLAEQKALNDAVTELQASYPEICFVSSISSSSTDHNQDDRWLVDATTTASRYMCYQCPNATVPGNDHVVIMCITDDASPIYSYNNYKGPDGENGPIGIPPNTTAWNHDFAKWNDAINALSGSDNKIRLGILQPKGYAGVSPRGGSLKPVNTAWPCDSDRNKITLMQLTTQSFTADDMLAAFKTITDNGDYAPTILYVVVDTSGSLGDPSDVDNTISAGVEIIQKTYTNLAIKTDVVDIGTYKAGELASPPPIDGYVTQKASDKYLWGYEYVSPAKQNILFPSLYVRATIDAAERWLGRAAGIVEQLLYYWMPKPAYIPTASYHMLVLVITDESNQNSATSAYDGYRSYEGAGYNTGYENYKEDKAQWNTWLSSLCSNQYCNIGILQLANPGPDVYPEQTDRGPDAYTLSDGTSTSGWIVDKTHEYSQTKDDILPDVSWGDNVNLNIEDGSFPQDSSGSVTHKVIPWRGFGEPRVTAVDIMDFYNQITNSGAICPDIIAVLLDTTPSMRPDIEYWINAAVSEHNNTTHGVTVDQVSSLSHYDDSLGRWIGPRENGTVDTLETDVGFVMSSEVNSAVLALQCIIPASGFTLYGYKHPLVIKEDYNGRWLEAINSITTYFLNKDNDTTFHVGDDEWWSSYRDEQCSSVENTTIPCTTCGSP